MGMLEGKQNGLPGGRQKVLQRQLAKDFGGSVLDSRVLDWLRFATKDELGTRSERIVDAATLDHVFSGYRPDWLDRPAHARPSVTGPQKKRENLLKIKKGPECIIQVLIFFGARKEN